jgi:predicted Rossmann fold flavoprotein
VHEVAIIGGGAAGLAAAVFVAQRGAGRDVVLLDGARTLGAKILVSGGGRCNVTNAVVEERDFNGGSQAAIRRVLRALPVSDTVTWFERMGVRLHEEAHGKLFPDSNRARTILDALVHEARAGDVRILAGQRVVQALRSRDGFTLVTSGGLLESRVIVLATGGLSLPSTGSDGAGLEMARALGHSIVPTTPALVPLVLEGSDHLELQGVSHQARLTVSARGQRSRHFDGSMLWTHFGISGPAVLDASRHLLRAHLDATGSDLTLAFPPFTDFAAADSWLLEQSASRPRAKAETALGDVLPASMADHLCRSVIGDGGAPLGALSREARRALAHRLSGWHLPVTGSRGYRFAEVTAGGVSLSEVDPSTMASRVCPGLFLVGEALDVDGRLGGFNFQWAWASARAAADGLRQSLGPRHHSPATP